MTININIKKVVARVGRPRGKLSKELRRRVVISLELRRRGFSQSQIAKYLRLSRKTINRYQNHPKYSKYQNVSKPIKTKTKVPSVQ